MRKLVVSVIGAVALTASAFAMAGGPDNMGNPVKTSGFYAGADMGYSYSPNGFDKLNSTAKSDLNTLGIKQTKDGFVFGGHLGYNFNQYIAAEAGYLRLPRIGYKASSGAFGTSNDFVGHENNNALYLAAKASYPIYDKLSVFAKAGYAFIFSNTGASFQVNGVTYNTTGASETYYNPLVGGGLEYRVLPKLGVNASYTAIIHVKNEYPTTHLFMGGLNYYF